MLPSTFGSKLTVVTYVPPPVVFTKPPAKPEAPPPKDVPIKPKGEHLVKSQGASLMMCPYCRRRAPFVGVMQPEPPSCSSFSFLLSCCPFLWCCCKPTAWKFRVRCPKCHKTSLSFHSDSQYQLLSTDDSN